jgi:hypothetical protein
VELHHAANQQVAGPHRRIHQALGARAVTAARGTHSRAMGGTSSSAGCSRRSVRRDVSTQVRKQQLASSAVLLLHVQSAASAMACFALSCVVAAPHTMTGGSFRHKHRVHNAVCAGYFIMRWQTGFLQLCNVSVCSSCMCESVLAGLCQRICLSCGQSMCVPSGQHARQQQRQA